MTEQWQIICKYGMWISLVCVIFGLIIILLWIKIGIEQNKFMKRFKERMYNDKMQSWRN